MSAGARILVVEDSPTQAAALAALLDEHGYAADVARNAERALALLQAEMGGAAPFALVLSDVVMPGMDGYELCRRIKAETWGPAVPVVLLTSLSDPLALVRGLESGADHYVTKPYESDRLIARVHQVITSPPSRDRPVGRPIDVAVLGGHFTITVGKEHIVELLVSSYEDLVRTSEVVRAGEQRARFLAEAGALLSSSLDAQRVLREVGRLAVPRIADACLVDVVEEGGAVRRVDVAVADPADGGVAQALCSRVERWADADVPAAAGGAIVALDDAVLARATDDDLHAGQFRALGARTAMVVPLVSRGTMVGRITLVSGRSARTFDDADLELAIELARRAALALDNARLYRAARDATQSRDDMLAIVSHDLRNPIHTIQMSTSFLLELLEAAQAPAPATIASQVQVMRRAASRANTLIQDLLDVSRIEAGRLSVNPSPVEAAAFLDEVMTEFAPLARAKSVALASAWDGDGATVPMDRERVAQVLSNLVGNAIKFTPAGGTIEVRGAVAGAHVEFVVRDSGPGIPADSMPNLFDRFWQAERGARHGAGLGLFIARGIVEAHGGTIRVESTEGEGATFRVALPTG